MGTAASPIGYALQGFGAITQGYQQKAAYEAESDKAKRTAIASRTAAAQTDVHLREELRTVQSNIDLIRSSAGVELYSPTGIAIHDEQARRSTEQRLTQTRNLRNQGTQSELDARALTYAGYASVQAGWLNGLSSIAKAVNAWPTTEKSAFPVGMPSGGI